MTNLQIITNAAVAANIFTADEAEAILQSGHSLPLHTFTEWKRMGFSVKKGEHARLKVEIWKKSTKKEQKEDGVEVDNGRFYRKLSHFFTLDQVERIATA